MDDPLSKIENEHGMAGVAELHAKYWNTLVSCGVPQREATELTCEWMNVLSNTQVEEEDDDD